MGTSFTLLQVQLCSSLLTILDTMAESVQYGYQDFLCNPLLQSYKVNGTRGLVDVYANYTIYGWNQAYGLGIPDEYAFVLILSLSNYFKEPHGNKTSLCTKTELTDNGSIKLALNLPTFKTLQQKVPYVPIWSI
jgi:hypothetical protein